MKMVKTLQAFAGKIYSLQDLRALREQQFKLFVPDQISPEVITDVGAFKHKFNAHLVTFSPELCSQINQAMHVSAEAQVNFVSSKTFGARMAFSQEITVSHSLYPALNSLTYFEPAKVTLFVLSVQSFGQQVGLVQSALSMLQKYAIACRNKFSDIGVGLLVVKDGSSSA